MSLLLCLCFFACSSELKSGAVEQVRLDLITEGMAQSAQSQRNTGVTFNIVTDRSVFHNTNVVAVIILQNCKG